MLKVFAYRNLHRDCWSVKALEGNLKGRVIYHAKAVTLWNCTFKVSEAGRQRVLRDQKKNVHAGVMGMLDEDTANWIPLISGVPVTYNPYKYDSFVFKHTEGRVDDASFVRLTDNKEVTAYYV